MIRLRCTSCLDILNVVRLKIDIWYMLSSIGLVDGQRNEIEIEINRSYLWIVFGIHKCVGCTKVGGILEYLSGLMSLQEHGCRFFKQDIERTKYKIIFITNQHLFYV